MVHDLEVPTRLREILMLYIVAMHISGILTTMYRQPTSTLNTRVCSGWRKTTVPGGQWPYSEPSRLLEETVRGGEQEDSAWSDTCSNTRRYIDADP